MHVMCTCARVCVYFGVCVCEVRSAVCLYVWYESVYAGRNICICVCACGVCVVRVYGVSVCVCNAYVCV